MDGTGSGTVEQSAGIKIGEVLHFFPRISVAELKPSKTLRVGDTIRITGKNIGFEQRVESMEIQHKRIEEAKPGDDIGLKVDQKVTAGCEVCKL